MYIYIYIKNNFLCAHRPIDKAAMNVFYLEKILHFEDSQRNRAK